jgi:hypothetical protein
MNGAAIIAEILRREGTEFLSCYPRNPLIEACAALDIRPILCRQERVGVGLADGYTRIKRGKRNGVFAAQAGPGIENAFPGIAKPFPRTSRCWSFRPGCRWRGNMCARCSAPPTFTDPSPSGPRWRIRFKNCPTSCAAPITPCAAARAGPFCSRFRPKSGTPNTRASSITRPSRSNARRRILTRSRPRCACCSRRKIRCCWRGRACSMRKRATCSQLWPSSFRRR